MADDSFPPTNLILQALHGIRGEIKDTNSRLESMDERLESMDDRLGRVETRLEDLGHRTTKGFLGTNTKLATLTKAVDHLAEAQSRLDKRFDYMLPRGVGAEVRDLRHRVTRLESSRISRRPKRK